MSKAYKDSGVDWIGIIPNDWCVEKGKHIFVQRNTKGNESPVLLAATQKSGMIPQSLLEGVVQVKLDTDLQTFKTVHIGDFVISLRSFQGGFEMSDYEGVCSPAYQVFYNTQSIFHKYYKYLFKSYGFISKMNSLVVGIREGKNIQYKDFAESMLPIPPLPTQQRIADFLDRKCAEIDELAALQETMIEELKRYKQSVITEAVTKGLDKNAKMKPSGVEWIGEIPEGWEVKRLKDILKQPLQYGANESGIPFNENLPRYVRITDILDNSLREDLAKQSLTEEQAKGYILKNNDILFARSGGTVGKAFIYKQAYGRCAFAGYLIKAAIKNENAQYVYYYTQTHCYDEWKRRIFIQATIQNIGADKYSIMELPIPPLTEQQQIADYLDRKCAEIDELIAIKQQKIEALKEYKKSVIFEYVTGKKEVAE
ncbi:MAG: restriction endonuclease subunit S [Bacteroidales bacterium]|nr:restriction endonuclease subunit S [Bacteroidales bacterium]